MSDGGSDPHKGSKIGRTLELARKERGLSFKQVEEATKIRAGYLEELERENFDVLPAVYVQGSLKTYANFLQLDGEALVQELKRRQASQREPAYVEPRQDASDLPTIPLGTAAVVGSKGTTEDEEDAGWTLFPAGINHYLYLGVGAFLVLVAVVLAFTLTGDRQPTVSQVREPLISQAPPEATPVENKEDNGPQPQPKGENRGAEDKNDGLQRERAAGPPDKDTGDESANRTAQSGQDDSRPAQDPRDTAATESAPPTAEPETTSTPPAAEESPQRRSPAGRAHGPKKNRSGSRDDDGFDVRITAGSRNPVRITGGVPGD
jgi:cytoskeletal protein RodZ